MTDGRFVTHGAVTKRNIPGIGVMAFKYCLRCNCLTEAPDDTDVESWWQEHTHQDDVGQFATYWLDIYCAQLTEGSAGKVHAWRKHLAEYPEHSYADEDVEKCAQLGAELAARFEYELRPLLVDVGLTGNMKDWGPKPLAHFARALDAHQEHLGRQYRDAVLCGLRAVFEFLQWVQEQGHVFAGLHPFANIAELSPEYLPVDAETWRVWVRVATGSTTDFLNHVGINWPRKVALPDASHFAASSATLGHHQSRASCAICSQLPDASPMELGPAPTDSSIPC